MTSTLIRRIAHLDMDAFYASAELLRYPQLKGLPVVIGGRALPQDEWMLAEFTGRLHEVPLAAFARLRDYTGRGVITTATYEARAFGLGSAMGMMKAAKLCPDAILLPVSFDHYRRLSKAFKEAVRAITPVMEDRGVDEIYLDFTDHTGVESDGGLALAQELQQAVQSATGGLTCSIGVAPNKQWAKMASEFQKPNGVSIVWPEDRESMIWPLTVRKINGIGPKAEAKLAALGIHTIGELAHFATHSFTQLSAHCGENYAHWLRRSALGENDSPLVTHSEPVSLSRETTFERDLHAVRDRATLTPLFTELCEKVAMDLKRKGYVGKTIGIKIKYANFKTVTRDTSIKIPTQDAQMIRKIAGFCLKRVDLSQRFRLLGVRVAGLSKVSEEF
jgi:DNA polymerase-4